MTKNTPIPGKTVPTPSVEIGLPTPSPYPFDDLLSANGGDATIGSQRQRQEVANGLQQQQSGTSFRGINTSAKHCNNNILARSSNKMAEFTNANQYEVEEEKLPSPPPLPLSHQVLSTPSALLGTSPGGFPCFTHSLGGGGKYGCGNGGSPTADDFGTMLPPPLSAISSSMSGSTSGMQQYSMSTDVHQNQAQGASTVIFPSNIPSSNTFYQVPTFSSSNGIGGSSMSSSATTLPHIQSAVKSLATVVAKKKNVVSRARTLPLRKRKVELNNDMDEDNTKENNNEVADQKLAQKPTAPPEATRASISLKKQLLAAAAAEHDDITEEDYLKAAQKAEVVRNFEDRKVYREVVVKTSAVAVKPSGADIGGRTAKRGRYTSFQQRIEDLKAYKEKHGHLNVKMDDDLSLYQFCTNAKHTMVHPDKKAKLKLDENRIAALEALGFSWSNDSSFDLEKHKTYFVKKPNVQARKSPKSSSSVPNATGEKQLLASVDFSSATDGPYPENWGAV